MGPGEHTRMMTTPPLWTTLDEHGGAFFKILHQTPRTQTGVMTVPPGQPAGPAEVHKDADQVIYIIDGEAEVKIWSDGPDEPPRHGDCPPGTLLVVPAGIRHWVRSQGPSELVFLTVYGPPAY